ncbi:MAG: hypothetical protein RLZZ450_2594 [Pseudomonadota bacterium]
MLTGVSALKRNERAEALKQAGCNSYTPDSPMAKGCDESYNTGLTWRRATIASAAISGGLLATTLLLFTFDKPVESRAARLLGACQLEAAPVLVRCTASF